MKPLSMICLVCLLLLTACATPETKIVKVTEYKAVVIPKNMTTVPAAPVPPTQKLYMQDKDGTKATTKEREEYLTNYIIDLLKDRRGLETQFTLIEDYQAKIAKQIEDQNHASKPN